MANPDSENPDLVRQHVDKNRKGDQELQKKPGRPTTVEPNSPDPTGPNDRTPPRKGDPEQVENVPGREPRPSRRPDPDETYRTGRQGPR